MADIQVGLAIRLTRIEKKLTQTQLGDRMGAPRSYVSKIERDKVRPYLEQFVRFADAMEVEPADLFTYARTLQREAEA